MHALLRCDSLQVESAQANVPERGTQKVPRLHENVLERLDRAAQMDRWFQNHGQGDLFVSALVAVFPLGPSQELAAQARRRMWDEAVRMVTTLVRRTEGAYRVGCSSSHRRRHAKEAALSMAEERGAVNVRPRACVACLLGVLGTCRSLTYPAWLHRAVGVTASGGVSCSTCKPGVWTPR